MRPILHFFSLLLVAALALSPVGCVSSGGGDGGNSLAGGGGPGTPESSDVTLLFNFDELLAMNGTDKGFMLAKIFDFLTMTDTAYAAYLYDFVTSLHITVTGSGMSTITHSQTITDPSNTLAVSLNIPNGSGRNFDVRLKDRNSNILYSGDLIIDIGSSGLSQDVTVSVDIDEGITADDYVAIGRDHLESHKLELAYVAFDTAICIDDDHPVAHFFRGITHLLLMVQKDDTSVDAASPNSDITSMLNLYANLDDIYMSAIAPDIYNEDYGSDLNNFNDNDWTEPTNITTDSGVDVFKNVLLAELDNVISDLAKAENDTVFATTLTTGMHFDITSTVRIDRADVYLFETIAYGLKAYWNHLLAYMLYTNANYWKYEMDRGGDAADNYQGIETVIGNDPGNAGEEALDLTGAASTYFSTAKTAYSTGLDKLKSGLQLIENRSIADKEADNHAFNMADAEDNVDTSLNLSKTDISKIITNIDQIKSALDGVTTITGYKRYRETGTAATSAGVNLARLFSTSTAPSRDSRPQFYYHSISKEELPVFDTNDTSSSAAFMDVYKGVLTKIKRSNETEWNYINDLGSAMSEDILPGPYLFTVPEKTIGMSGSLSDFSGVNPVMFDEKDEGESASFDLLELFTTKDSTYLYIGARFRGAPYTGSFATNEYLNYHLYFACNNSNLWTDSAAVTIELRGYPNTWSWHLWSYGQDKGAIAAGNLGTNDYEMGDMVEFRIPLSYLTDLINEYEPDDHFPTGTWDGKEIYVGFGYNSYISSAHNSDSMGGASLARISE
ncbi:MAG: hypothetical protein HQ558_04380 [Candidatus Omnitrophica bacterium]|nr:hypothetical protein [Candidatus Omnitrophota bacterium]